MDRQRSGSPEHVQKGRASVRGYLNITAGKVLTAMAFVTALGAPRKW
jgi:hypothetical protein